MKGMDWFLKSARRLSIFGGGISFLGIFDPFTERDVINFAKKIERFFFLDRHFAFLGFFVFPNKAFSTSMFRVRRAWFQ